jgi:hypothetical protein
MKIRNDTAIDPDCILADEVKIWTHGHPPYEDNNRYISLCLLRRGVNLAGLFLSRDEAKDIAEELLRAQ